MGLQPKSVLRRESYGVAIGYNVAGPLARSSLRTRFEKMWVMERGDCRSPRRWREPRKPHVGSNTQPGLRQNSWNTPLFPYS